MFQELEQSFAALSSRDKMKFLRWAAESVGAKLDTIFSGPQHGSHAELSTRSELGEADIPEFLKR